MRLCVLLWEYPGCADRVAAYEDAVLALLPDHGGRVLTRSTVTDRAVGDPLEVQLIELRDENALESYLQDPARADLARVHDRDAIVARTQMLRLSHRASTDRPALQTLEPHSRLRTPEPDVGRVN